MRNKNAQPFSDLDTEIVTEMDTKINYFCAGLPCGELSPGAIPSGWVGGEN